MVKNTIISAVKANSLFWLGRYEERVYITLHLLRKCHDKMIDGELEDYWPIWQKLDTTGAYQTIEEFTFGIMYDDTNPSTVMAAQTKAMDNAILLREDILSETLSYLEMSLALLKECRKKQEKKCHLSAACHRLVAGILGLGTTAVAEPQGTLHYVYRTKCREFGHATSI